ncbi:PP2C family protein-serine/threonine phosphatase [Acanthopleuribacter pedis]|uniref:Serine/threonine-protein phosphatase n=1 Tax=Acanthopleuribacter pedis TaxID=442870 RepID=A0A8J7Q6D5_9BACT|nr:protein phosphatase 2C domain-containing protein [Acanthopleuribacter pedis]MBO1318946.1 serine/threonine-protein phosphatase [Acanthopleuribacter pedis]
MNQVRVVQVNGLTDVGCVRSGNEDCFLIQTTNQARPELNPSGTFTYENETGVFIAVSDGMGGAAAGEVASETTLHAIRDYIDDHRADLNEAAPEEIAQIIEASVHWANRAIFAKARELDIRKPMGATLTSAFLKDAVLYLCQIGDSRAYCFRDGNLLKITRDQSFVGHLVELGTITEVQALRHPQRNVILQALGTQDNLKVDVSYLPLCKGDIIVLCSDGLYSEFTPEKLQERVRASCNGSLEDFVKTLVTEAKSAGGKDNITVVGMHVNEGFPVREPGEVPGYLAFPFLEADNPLKRVNSIFH